MIKGLLILVMACLSTVIHADWPTYHGAPDLRGVSSAMLPDVPELLWRYNAGSDVDSTPVSDGDRIFFSSKKGMVVALDLKGSEVWKKTFTRMNDAGQEMPLRFEAPLACGGGLVFAGSTRGTLFALDAGTANLLGTNVVLIDQSEGALHCVDAQTGKLVWKTEGVERCDGSAGIGNGKIVFGSCLAALHVFDVDGQHVKDIEVGGDGQIAGGVAVDGPLAFAIVWSSDESVEQTFSTPAVLDKLVVYASDNGYVYAVDRADGKLAWKFDTVGMPYSPAVAGDKVVASADGKLFLLKLDDGTKIWSKEISDEITGPAIINGMIVIGADDGTVSAFGSP
jgi:outer membrane protein assembly factor BamB